MSDVRIVRLSTGEEILCEVKVDGEFYTLENLALIVPTKEQSIGLAPYLPYAKQDKFTVNGRFVMYVVEPHPDLRAQWSNIFGKVFAPEKKIII